MVLYVYCESVILRVDKVKIIVLGLEVHTFGNHFENSKRNPILWKRVLIVIKKSFTMTCNLYEHILWQDTSEHAQYNTDTQQASNE